MTLNAISVATAITVFWIPAVAAPQERSEKLPTNDKVVQDCGEQWGSAGAMASCVMEKEKEFGSVLEAEYRSALKRVKSSSALRDSQRQWLKYQESACAIARSQGAHEGPDFARLSYATCLLRTTLQRVGEIKGL